MKYKVKTKNSIEDLYSGLIPGWNSYPYVCQITAHLLEYHSTWPTTKSKQSSGFYGHPPEHIHATPTRTQLLNPAQLHTEFLNLGPIHIEIPLTYLTGPN